MQRRESNPCHITKLHILFDLDRTLWDFDGNADRTYRVIFERYQLERLCHVDYLTFHERYRQINDMLWDAYRNGTIAKEQLSLQRFSLTLGAFGCDSESPDIIRLSLQMADDYVVEGARQTGLMPGTRELLDWLDERRDRYTLSVITNGFSEAQLPKMRTSGIDRYFSHFFLSEDIGFMKPDRRFFEAVMRELAVPASHCLVVGDDYKVDIAGAIAVGIPQVYYNPGGHSVGNDVVKPTYEIKHLSQLKDILASTPSSPRAQHTLIPPIHVVAHIDNNPVKAGLVKEPSGWKWSSSWWEREAAHEDVGVPASSVHEDVGVPDAHEDVGVPERI